MYVYCVNKHLRVKVILTNIFLKCGIPCSKERKKEKKPTKSNLKSDENEKETKDASSNTKPVFDIHKDSNQESQVKSFKLKCDFCEKYFYCSESLGIHLGMIGTMYPNYRPIRNSLIIIIGEIHY